MRKAFVAGGLGFLGANVVSALQRRDYAVEVCSRRTGVDIRDFDQIARVLEKVQPNLVINCAVHAGGIAYNAIQPVAVYEDNLLMGFNLVKAAVRARVQKFVNVMPNCTYPGEAEIYSEPEWWNGPLDPTVLTYALARKALWAHTYAHKNEPEFTAIHLVLPNLYGPRDPFDIVRSHALGALTRKIVDAKNGGIDHVEIWGTGAPVREWMYVEDAVEGIVIASERISDAEILNLGRGEGCSIRDLAEMIARSAGWRGRFVYDTTKPDGAPRKILDVTKMKSKLAWFPPTSLAEGIQKTVEWYIAHRHEYV